MTETVGHNSGAMSDQDREHLFFFHLREYRTALAAKKAADAAMKNCGKSIKADLGEFGLDQLKDYERAQTPEGEAKLKAKMEAQLQAMRWAGLPVNAEPDMFEDLIPVIERAAREGLEAGMRGDALANPYNEASEEGRAYAENWHAGQGAIFAIKKKRDEAAAGSELIKGSADAGDDPFAEAAE